MSALSILEFDFVSHTIETIILFCCGVLEAANFIIARARLRLTSEKEF